MMNFDSTPLSKREKDLAKILLQGKSNKQIATDLGISNRTVEFHLRNVYTKLGVASRTERSTVSTTAIVLPSHTVNGYTAEIESYYADISHIIFMVRITGGDLSFGDADFYGQVRSPDIFDEHAELINSRGGWRPAIDPALYQFEFVPLTLFKADHIKGQFALEIAHAPDYNKILADFRFDFDIPIYPDVRFYPKQTLTALALTIPQLEKTNPDVLLTNQLSVNYPGWSEKQAYYTFLEEHGNIYQGPWKFAVELTP